MRFCDRDQEISQIVDRWNEVCKISDPKTQVVVIKAERGIGKTRLASEFYRWLSENVDGAGEAGYWPDTVVMRSRSIGVNPDPRRCKFELPIPFLWWGIRGVDVATENAPRSDAIATYGSLLAPHLVTLTLRARLMNSGKAIAETWLDIAKGELASWTGYDSVMTIGEGILNTAAIVRGTLEETGKKAVREALDRGQIDRNEAILQDLEKVFNPKRRTFASIPGVILIDDAQFAQTDVGLASFVGKLINKAVSQNWPILILVTHWRRELETGIDHSEQSFSRVLHHALGVPDSCKSDGSEDIPAGFLDAEQYREIDLRPVSNLSEALREEVPGLLPKQSEVLLKHAGGNPRHLEQIVAFLLENEVFFDGFDVSHPLTEEGLSEALEETHDIEKIVLRRLRDSPQEVQEAVCIGAALGMKFTPKLVAEILRIHLGREIGVGLKAAETPYSMVINEVNESITEFSERLFYVAAQRRRRSLKALHDDAGLQISIKNALRLSLVNLKGFSLDAKISIYNLAGSILRFDERDKTLALEALADLAVLEVRRHAHDAALEAAVRFHSLFSENHSLVLSISPERTWAVAHVLIRERRVKATTEILEVLVKYHREEVERLDNISSFRCLSQTLELMSDAARLDHKPDLKIVLDEENLTLRREMRSRDDSTFTSDWLFGALLAEGDGARSVGDADRAIALYEEALSNVSEADKRFRLGNIRSGSYLRKMSKCLDRIASSLLDLQQYNLAEEKTKESTKLARSAMRHDVKGRERLSSSLLQAGIVAAAREDSSKARGYFSECLSLRRSILAERQSVIDSSGVSEVLHNIGKIEEEGGDLKAALVAFAEAATLARRAAERTVSVVGLSFLHKTSVSAGQVALGLENIPMALEYCGEALTTAQAIHEIVGSEDAMFDLCKSTCMLVYAQLKAGNLVSARLYLAEGKLLARRLKDKNTGDSVWEICEELERELKGTPSD